MNEIEAKPIEPKLWTKEQAAEFLSVNIRTVQDWMAAGILPYYKIGRRTVRFKAADVQARLEKRCLVLNSVRARLKR